ncbi:MAG: FliH/SctL family protein [Oceanococcus sp.]
MNNADEARVWHNIGEAQAWSQPEFESAVRSRDAAAPKAPPTAAELGQLQEKAYAEAFEQGRAAGYAEGRASGEQEVQAGIERLHIIASALSSPLDELDRDLEYSLVNLALILARRIVGRSVHDDPEALSSLVKQAVAVLGAELESPVDLYMNSRDLEFLQQHDLVEAAWNVHQDDELQCGDVKVRRGLAEVDGRLQQRLDRLAADMLHV